ncbi:MAG: hypothetical protein MHM6MM_007187 [Cercozoa sp. M6MM]
MSNYRPPAPSLRGVAIRVLRETAEQLRADVGILVERKRAAEVQHERPSKRVCRETQRAIRADDSSAASELLQALQPSLWAPDVDFADIAAEPSESPSLSFEFRTHVVEVCKQLLFTRKTDLVEQLFSTEFGQQRVFAKQLAKTGLELLDFGDEVALQQAANVIVQEARLIIQQHKLSDEAAVRTVVYRRYVRDADLTEVSVDAFIERVLMNATLDTRHLVLVRAHGSVRLLMARVTRVLLEWCHAIQHASDSALDRPDTRPTISGEPVRHTDIQTSEFPTPNSSSSSNSDDDGESKQEEAGDTSVTWSRHYANPGRLHRAARLAGASIAKHQGAREHALFQQRQHLRRQERFRTSARIPDTVEEQIRWLSLEHEVCGFPLKKAATVCTAPTHEAHEASAPKCQHRQWHRVVVPLLHRLWHCLSMRQLALREQVRVSAQFEGLLNDDVANNETEQSQKDRVVDDFVSVLQREKDTFEQEFQQALQQSRQEAHRDLQLRMKGQVAPAQVAVPVPMPMRPMPVLHSLSVCVFCVFACL